MGNVLAYLEAFDAAQPDGLLVALADAPGVERDSIRIACVPLRAHHGHHAVSWRQGGRQRTTEGSTLDRALRAAVRAAQRTHAWDGVRNDHHLGG